ncbi:MAG: hypothetical protein DMF61_21335 [Blastocatellia bacterium AA13]|nr:MAG: hypothetical protein DMF61_21335 [Blastocatellia bacterium AA13]
MSTTKCASEEWISAMRLTWARLKDRADVIQSLEPRAIDVLWPLFNYRDLDIELFERSTMLLLADEAEKRLILNEITVADTYEQLSNPETAVRWFWFHQMVHVTQGLSYKTFRELNIEPDRIETTRADVWADFIALKTLAILELLEGVDVSQINARTIRERESALFYQVVWPMVKMKQPNYFVPFEREFEARRVMSLLVLGVLLEDMVNSDGSETIDESVFVNWRTGKDALYVWYGQTNLLGRQPIMVNEDEIHLIADAIMNAQYNEALNRVRALPLPRGAELQEYCRRSVV